MESLTSNLLDDFMLDIDVDDRVNEEDENGNTPLIFAVLTGRKEAVENLHLQVRLYSCWRVILIMTYTHFFLHSFRVLVSIIRIVMGKHLCFGLLLKDSMRSSDTLLKLEQCSMWRIWMEHLLFTWLLLMDTLDLFVFWSRMVLMSTFKMTTTTHHCTMLFVKDVQRYLWSAVHLIASCSVYSMYHVIGYVTFIDYSHYFTLGHWISLD